MSLGTIRGRKAETTEEQREKVRQILSQHFKLTETEVEAFKYQRMVEDLGISVWEMLQAATAIEQELGVKFNMLVLARERTSPEDTPPVTLQEFMSYTEKHL